MPLRALAAGLLVVAPALAAAQETRVPFGGLRQDTTLPVEITADTLELDQAAGTAVFVGGVRVGQGAMRLAADRVEVFYVEAEGSETGQVERMTAAGNVTLTNGAEAAEADAAEYRVATGIIEMEGDVLLTQGQNALASDRLRIDLAAGNAVLEGRVQTIFTPEESQ